jgi:lysozyme
MKLHPQVTRTAVELVKRFEGLRRRAARLPDGGWTLGYGHTRTAREGAEVTEEEAELLLYYDLSEVATKVEAWTFTPLSQNQFEALTAFAFNIGTENFRRSTVLKRLNEGQYLQAAAAMELWRKTEVDGEAVVVDALVRRRAAEKAHFLTPPDGFRPSPTPVMTPAFDFSVIEAAAQSHAAGRVAEVDAPMDGEDAVAHIERSPPVAKPDPSPPEAVAPPAPVEHTPDVEAVSVHTVAAEAPADPVVHAPAFWSEPEPADPPEPDEPEDQTSAALVAPAAPSNPDDVLAAPPAPAASAATPFGFRGFEPPAPRFTQPREPDVAPERAQPVRQADNDIATYAPAPAASESPPVEQPLFERPLAPPPPSVAGLPVERVIRSIPSQDQVGPVSSPKVADRPRAGGSLLFGGLGCLGVLLFALTLTSMLTGKASIAHLFVGLAGVVLMTLAGIHFLLKRWGGEADATLDDMVEVDGPTP